MSITVPYTHKEFLTILTDIRRQIPTNDADWNDFLESNIGRVLIDVYAAIADLLAFTIDRQAAETFIDTLEFRDSAVGLLRLIGYQLANPAPKTVQVSFSLSPFENQLQNPSSLAGAGWIRAGVNGAAAPTVSPDSNSADDGTLTADTIVFPATSITQRSRISQTGTQDYTGKTIEFSAILKSASATKVWLVLENVEGTTEEEVQVDTFYQERKIFRAFTTNAPVTARLETRDFQQNGRNIVVSSCSLRVRRVGSTIILPKYTNLKSDDGVPFVTVQDAFIPPGSLTVSAETIQGKWASTNFTSVGQASMRYQVSSSSIANGYVRVFVSGEEWTLARLNSLALERDDAEVFCFYHTKGKQIIVQFGDNIEGKIPPAGSLIEIRYLETLGSRADTKSETISSIIDEILDATSTVIPDLKVLNAQPAIGGSDFETVAHARLVYPKAFKALDRAVTREDYEFLTRTHPDVLQVKVLDLEDDPGIPFYVVQVLVLNLQGLPSQGLNDIIQAFLDQRVTAAGLPQVKSPTALDTDVSVLIRLFPNFVGSSVIAQVSAAIRDFFTPTADPDSEIQIGGSLLVSRLTTRIQSVPGVRSISSITPSNDIVVDPFSFVRLRQLNVQIQS